MKDNPTVTASNVTLQKRSAVDFFVNCFERDYREVLSDGFVRRKAARFNHPFRRLIVTINNVNDLSDAKRLADAALAAGHLDRVLYVREELPRALKQCGLTERSLRRVIHFLDFLLVTVTSTDADYVAHCSADVEQDTVFDWITPAIEQLRSNERYLVANPSWTSNLDVLSREALTREGPYFVGPGFSDQCFLVEQRRLAQPVYQCRHESMRRFPMADMGAIFEARVDAYMRQHGLLRLTDSRVSYSHTGTQGMSYASPGLWQRARRKVERHFRECFAAETAAEH
jgi:hypothetical protein